MAKSKNKDLRRLREEQLAAANRRTAADDGVHDDAVDAEGYDEGYDEGTKGGPVDEEELDLDAFDLDDLGDEDDDSDAGDLTITHEDDEDDDADAGDLTITHEDDDEDDETDAGDLTITHEDDDEDDETDAGDLTITHEDDDEEDDTEAWVEENVVSGMVEAALLGENTHSRKAMVRALSERGFEAGAALVSSLSKRHYGRLAMILDNLVEASREVLAEVRAAEARCATITEKLRDEGKEREAQQVEQNYREAMSADLEESDLSFECPGWLTAAAEDFLGDQDDDEDDETDAGDLTITHEDDDEEDDTEASPDELVAQAVYAAVKAKKSKKAARIIAGVINEDSIEAARVCARLVHQGRIEMAAEMAAEIRQAAYNVDPDVKPVQVDPSQPVTPGAPNRMMGPPPDAGFSYGGSMDEKQLKQACDTLACGPEAMAWVKQAPMTDDGQIDPTGKWACYTEGAGQGPAEEMDTEACKAYLAKRASTVHAMLLANIANLDGEDVPKDSVAMTLHDATSDSPFWNVIIGGVPVGTIHLQDQERPEQIRAMFVSDTYREGIRDSIATFGSSQTLERVAARYWAAAFNEAEAVTHARDAISAEAEKVLEERVAVVVGDKMALMALAHEAFQRNLVEQDNPLKWALTERLAAAGIADPALVAEEALSYQIQAGVDNNGDPVFMPASTMYLQALYAQAEEYSKLHPEALEQVSMHILQTPVKLRQAAVDPRAGQSLRERLASANVPVMSVPTAQGDTEERPTSKNELRAALRIGNRWR